MRLVYYNLDSKTWFHLDQEVERKDREAITKSLMQVRNVVRAVGSINQANIILRQQPEPTRDELEAVWFSTVFKK